MKSFHRVQTFDRKDQDDKDESILHVKGDAEIDDSRNSIDKSSEKGKYDQLGKSLLELDEYLESSMIDYTEEIIDGLIVENGVEDRCSGCLFLAPHVRDLYTERKKTTEQLNKYIDCFNLLRMKYIEVKHILEKSEKMNSAKDEQLQIFQEYIAIVEGFNKDKCKDSDQNDFDKLAEMSRLVTEKDQIITQLNQDIERYSAMFEFNTKEMQILKERNERLRCYKKKLGDGTTTRRGEVTDRSVYDNRDYSMSLNDKSVISFKGLGELYSLGKNNNQFLDGNYETPKFNIKSFNGKLNGYINNNVKENTNRILKDSNNFRFQKKLNSNIHLPILNNHNNVNNLNNLTLHKKQFSTDGYEVGTHFNRIRKSCLSNQISLLGLISNNPSPKNIMTQIPHTITYFNFTIINKQKLPQLQAQPFIQPPTISSQFFTQSQTQPQRSLSPNYNSNNSRNSGYQGLDLILGEQSKSFEAKKSNDSEIKQNISKLFDTSIDLKTRNINNITYNLTINNQHINNFTSTENKIFTFTSTSFTISKKIPKPLCIQNQLSLLLGPGEDNSFKDAKQIYKKYFKHKFSVC